MQIKIRDSSLIFFIGYEHKSDNSPTTIPDVITLKAAITAWLSNNGFCHWQDHELGVADDWRDEIKRNINRCHVFLAVIGKRIVAGGNWTLNELEYANNNCKPIAIFASVDANQNSSPIAKYPPFQIADFSSFATDEVDHSLEANVSMHLENLVARLFDIRKDLSVLRTKFNTSENRIFAFNLKVLRNVPNAVYDISIGKLNDGIYPDPTELILVFLFRLSEQVGAVRHHIVDEFKHSSLNTVDLRCPTEVQAKLFHCMQQLVGIDGSDWRYTFHIDVSTVAGQYLFNTLRNCSNDEHIEILMRSSTEMLFNNSTGAAEIAEYISNVASVAVEPSAAAIQIYFNNLCKSLLDGDFSFNSDVQRREMWQLATDISCCGYTLSENGTPVNPWQWLTVLAVVSSELALSYAAHLCELKGATITNDSFTDHVMASPARGTLKWIHLCIFAAQWYLLRGNHVGAKKMLQIAAKKRGDKRSPIELPRYVSEIIENIAGWLSEPTPNIQVTQMDDSFIIPCKPESTALIGIAHFLKNKPDSDNKEDFNALAKGLDLVRRVSGVCDDYQMGAISEGVYKIITTIVEGQTSGGRLSSYAEIDGIDQFVVASFAVLTDPGSSEKAMALDRSNKLRYLHMVFLLSVAFPEVAKPWLSSSKQPVKNLSTALLTFLGCEIDALLDNTGSGDPLYEATFLCFFAFVLYHDGEYLLADRIVQAHQKLCTSSRQALCNERDTQVFISNLRANCIILDYFDHKTASVVFKSFGIKKSAWYGFVNLHDADKQFKFTYPSLFRAKSMPSFDDYRTTLHAASSQTKVVLN